MRPRRYYGAGFLLVLIAAIFGAYLARQAVGSVEAPKLDGLASVQQSLEDLNIWALLPLPEVAPRSTTTPLAAVEAEEAAGAPTAVATLQPIVVAAVEQPEVTPGPSVAPGEQATPTDQPAAAPSATLPLATPTTPVDAGLPFAAAGPVRHSSGDCAGASIRGVVRDSGGNPLPLVRLWRYDQWGNEQVIESKSGDADRGAYDFPLGDTPNVHYVQIIDAAGVIVSPVIEIAHRQGDASDATCHWLDWVGR